MAKLNSRINFINDSGEEMHLNENGEIVFNGGRIFISRTFIENGTLNIDLHYTKDSE